MSSLAPLSISSPDKVHLVICGSMLPIFTTAVFVVMERVLMERKLVMERVLKERVDAVEKERVIWS